MPRSDPQMQEARQAAEAAAARTPEKRSPKLGKATRMALPDVLLPTQPPADGFN